jgi:hypothetical protein
MKKFLKKLLVAGLLGVGVPALIVAGRLLVAQRTVRETFTLKPETEVVFIGNSHTGCTWHEDPVYKNRVLWRSASPFVFAYMRLLELERLGMLSGVKICVMDCDATSMENLTMKSLERQFLFGLPFTWRYFSLIPLSKIRLGAQVCWKPFVSYRISAKPPPDTVPWSTRTREERRKYLLRNYGEHPPWNDPMLCKGWEEDLLGWIEGCQRVCSRYGVRLILFAGPLVADNPQRADPRWRGKVDEMIERIRARGIEYFDFRAACSDDLFRDAHHLSQEGARVFTKRFYASVLREENVNECAGGSMK